MDLAAKLAVMLGAGLLTRWAFAGAGRRLAIKSSLKIPALLSYALAGTSAALFRIALEAWTALPRLGIWIAFGTVWGIVAGLLLPFARPRVSSES